MEGSYRLSRHSKRIVAALGHAPEIARLEIDDGEVPGRVGLGLSVPAVADVAMPARYGDGNPRIKYADSIPTTSTMVLPGVLWRLKRKSLVTEFNPLARWGSRECWKRREQTAGRPAFAVHPTRG